MQSTNAKALVRNFFYKDILPAQFNPLMIATNNHLVLLGKDDDELQLLQALGVLGHKIYSVENDRPTFVKQSHKIEKSGFGIVLYFGELVEFITHYLQTNQRFIVLNLDIYGSYLRNIDPVMTQILLFARRNPQTMSATYSNVGRDPKQLLEGLKSLALFFWLSPQKTQATASELYERYRATGRSERISFNMVLRHFFWVRSHMEHVLAGTVMIGGNRQVTVEKIFATWNTFWLKIVDSLPSTITIGGLKQSIKMMPPPPISGSLDLQIRDLTIATYRASSTFYHTGWFSTYESIQPVKPQVWLDHALDCLIKRPLYFADAQADKLSEFWSVGQEMPDNLVIWDQPVTRSALRQITVLPFDASVKKLATILQPTPKVRATEKVLDLQEIQHLIRSFAVKGLNTNQIIELLPSALNYMSKQSITARIAIARRKKV